METEPDHVTPVAARIPSAESASINEPPVPQNDEAHQPHVETTPHTESSSVPESKTTIPENQDNDLTSPEGGSEPVTKSDASSHTDHTSLPESDSQTNTPEHKDDDRTSPVRDVESSSGTQDNKTPSPTAEDKSSSDAFFPSRQPLSSIPKAHTLATSTPISSRNSSPMIDDTTSLQDKEVVSSSDNPTSCSTPASNDDSEDMVSAHGPITNTPSRPLDLDIEGSIASQMTMGSTQTFHSAVTFVEPEIRAPIIDYEIMEQRAKFTVFKIHVQFSEVDSWFIFRRYTDFVRLNDRLRAIYPSFRLALPPKRWFGSNFDPNFLEDRQLGLQAFLNNITGHKEIVQSSWYATNYLNPYISDAYQVTARGVSYDATSATDQPEQIDPVHEFLCLDDPPGAHDSLEESRALCESLEETVYNLRKDLSTRDTQLARTKLELAEAKHAIASLLEQGEKAGIQLSCPELNSSSPSIESDSSAADYMSQVEADQVRPMEQSYRQEHRMQRPANDVINLSQERSSGIFSSPNCNINNSTEYSLHIASTHSRFTEPTDQCPEPNGHSMDNEDDRAVPVVAKIISVT